MSYFERHVFFCCNQRKDKDDEMSCGDYGAQKMRDYARDKIEALELDGPGKIRISNAGCLGRCEEGPVIVIYPDAVWYTYVDQEDIDEIIREHLQGGRVVERLKL